MTHQLPPIAKLSEHLLREIEQAVRGFARYHKYTLGTDLRQQAMQVVRVCHRAWRDRPRQAYWTDQLVWAIDEIKLSLQLDIHNFFNSIHRPTLWRILKPVLQKHRLAPVAQHATHALLSHAPLRAGVRMRGHAEEFALVPEHKRLANAAPGCGLPIGNLSSQLFANIYLDRLDQFIKHTLKARRYVRYVDDFVLVHRDREVLACWQNQIAAFLGRELRLRLKDDIRLRALADGIDFLGYVIRPTHTMVRRRVVSHLRSTLAAWEREHVRADIIHSTPVDLQRVQSVVSSYSGHLRHANSHKLRRSMIHRFNWLPTGIRRRRFKPEDLHMTFKFRIGGVQ